MLRATKVKRIRGLQGLTQQELARRAGINNVNLCGIERGNVSPSLATLIKLGDALDIDPLSLLDEPPATAGKRELTLTV